MLNLVLCVCFILYIGHVTDTRLVFVDVCVHVVWGFADVYHIIEDWMRV